MSQAEGSLERLVRKVEARAAAGEAVSIGTLRNVAGAQAAGPMLLLPALIVVSPLSILPGVPSLAGLNTVLVAGQLMLGRNRIWLPGWLARRSLAPKHVGKLLSFLYPVSRMADGVVRRRWLVLTGTWARRLGAGVCVLMGAIMPLLEFIPLSSTIAASVIAIFALALSARDGLLTLVWWGCLAVLVALGLWLAPQAIGLVFGVDVPDLVPPLEGTPLEILDPLLPGGDTSETP
ncbi:exopolysaccharide biosynthesis protein [Devosia sp. 919]|uniref:exopolysaccharide biosynthesis protein n=1 Tax=Devosia sp. 919 TaxID=2726065 RepID=UPI001555905D|nr:exopolysaccharide biosynthesis protein [Devosia sp. 919]